MFVDLLMKRRFLEFKMLVASSCSALIASDMPYILPEHPLRVSKKPKSHLEKVNEDVLVGITSGDECGQWAGPGQRASQLCGLLCYITIEND